MSNTFKYLRFSALHLHKDFDQLNVNTHIYDDCSNNATVHPSDHVKWSCLWLSTCTILCCINESLADLEILFGWFIIGDGSSSSSSWTTTSIFTQWDQWKKSSLFRSSWKTFNRLLILIDSCRVLLLLIHKKKRKEQLWVEIKIQLKQFNQLSQYEDHWFDGSRRERDREKELK